ncbi:MAG: type II toxin-antitoxin system VapB family antitoxin [Thermodesulfobacteriota bacterium]
MKTTIHIPDSLFEEARAIAAKERTTFKALVEEGLRRVITDRQQRGRFVLRKATFRGNGLHAGLSGASWEQVRALAYEGRGERLRLTPIFWCTLTVKIRFGTRQPIAESWSWPKPLPLGPYRGSACTSSWPL